MCVYRYTDLLRLHLTNNNVEEQEQRLNNKQKYTTSYIIIGF